MESSSDLNLLTVPEPERSNWILFSMQSIRGINKYLKEFPKADLSDGTGMSASLVWSGIQGCNTPTTVFQRKKIGIVLDPTLVDVPQADWYAMHSGGKVEPIIEKKQAKNFSGTLFTSKYENKKGYYRTTPDDSLEWTANLASFQVLGDKQSIYHDQGSASNFARNVWRKYFKKHKNPKKFIEEIHDGRSIFRYNEAIAFQKGDRNPICGLLISDNLDTKTYGDLLGLLKSNPSFKLYLYDNKAEEHIMRFLENDHAIKYLNDCRDGNNNFESGFKKATPFSGFKQLEINNSTPTPASK